MARIRLELPSSFHFSTKIEVRISDINYGGHLGNDAMLAVIHEARLRFLKTFGWSEFNICGTSLIMTDCAIVYKSEVFHGETLRIDVAIGDITRTGFDFFYRIFSANTDKEVGKAKTGVAFFDYQKKKVTSTPESFLAKIPVSKTG